MLKTLALVVLGVTSAYADVYMHNPRGSNCRNREASTYRDNGNRLFDTQNNGKGGYCHGPMMHYYEGSELTIEWTNQHGCGNPKLECNLVIQYMCGKAVDEPEIQIRDGLTTNTIPDDRQAYNSMNQGEYEFGMHESFEYYQECKARNRNKGLFLADRETENGVGERAINTRQNNGGGRRGFECPEERDYYPYWHPTPWKDIAILTNSIEQCSYYQAESQNVVGKGFCKPEARPGERLEYHHYNTETECKADGQTWEVKEPWDIDPPKCVLAPWNRHNHLGNGVNGFTNSFNWTLPTSSTEECISEGEDGSAGCACVLRLRYNISTGDINGWGLRNKGDELDGAMSDQTQNKDNSPVKDDPYVPVVGLPEANLSIALDTTQFGRTFQDRSHVFNIRERPSGIPAGARVYNLNVRGKRGNIVQTFPSVEYDFVPQHLECKVGDFIHFQWTGCDTNPAGNAGEGTAGTDRSNINQLRSLDMSYPADEEWLAENPKLFDDTETALAMAYLNQEKEGSCLTYQQLLEKNNNNNNNVEQDVQNCMKLNAASAYFDGGALRMNTTGDFAYMSHRNNNFSNRGQKGIIKVDMLLSLWAVIVIAVAGFLFVGAGAVAGGLWYSQSHPHSGVAQFFDRFNS